jgi:GTP:adenosylcobinamide-phosphate guanylyltransferase
MVDALILAGGESSDGLSKLSNEPYEALIGIAGKPMVTFVAEALAKSQLVQRIFIIGPAIELSRCDFPENSTIVQGGQSLQETIKLGMSAVNQEEKVLVVTCDIPLLTEPAIKHFLESCQRVDADLYYPVIEKKISERDYPGNKRTYVKFKEGLFTGGNIFLVNPRIVPSGLQQANYLFENRKNPLKLCQFLGITFVLRFFFGQLSLQAVAERASKLLQIRGAVIQSPFAEVGMDVDKPSDLELVRNTFSVRV